MSNGGWIKKISEFEFVRIAYKEYPNWDKVNEEPYFVRLETVKSEGDMFPLKMASLFDDVAEGNFYYRDWTKDGIPFVNDGETYWSGFWFQFSKDAKAFKETYGGVGNWEEGFKEFSDQCNKKRNGEI